MEWVRSGVYVVHQVRKKTTHGEKIFLFNVVPFESNGQQIWRNRWWLCFFLCCCCYLLSVFLSFSLSTSVPCLCKNMCERSFLFLSHSICSLFCHASFYWDFCRICRHPYFAMTILVLVDVHWQCLFDTQTSECEASIDWKEQFVWFDLKWHIEHDWKPNESVVICTTVSETRFERLKPTHRWRYLIRLKITIESMTNRSPNRYMRTEDEHRA